MVLINVGDVLLQMILVTLIVLVGVLIALLIVVLPDCCGGTDGDGVGNGMNFSSGSTLPQVMFIVLFVLAVLATVLTCRGIGRIAHALYVGEC